MRKTVIMPTTININPVSMFSILVVIVLILIFGPKISDLSGLLGRKKFKKCKRITKGKRKTNNDTENMKMPRLTLRRGDGANISMIENIL
jgi:hypothetical protein